MAAREGRTGSRETVRNPSRRRRGGSRSGTGMEREMQGILPRTVQNGTGSSATVHLHHAGKHRDERGSRPRSLGPAMWHQPLGRRIERNDAGTQGCGPANHSPEMQRPVPRDREHRSVFVAERRRVCKAGPAARSAVGSGRRGWRTKWTNDRATDRSGALGRFCRTALRQAVERALDAPLPGLVREGVRAVRGFRPHRGHAQRYLRGAEGGRGRAAEGRQHGRIAGLGASGFVREEDDEVLGASEARPSRQTAGYQAFACADLRVQSCQEDGELHGFQALLLLQGQAARFARHQLHLFRQPRARGVQASSGP
mmetsp:Transcript_1763/g.10863  ORF Transcript_1763/g.10863 Transcript_1763/m.10863 type:complete len:312 (-) Transcript_1763:2050-2985(-)